MLFKQAVLERIASGEIMLAFRRWQRPSVKAGGTLLTAIGQLAIEKVEQISLDKLTRREALSAGYEDLKSLQDELTSDRPSTLYRIKFRLAGADPRIKLRANDLLSADDLEKIDCHSAAKLFGSRCEHNCAAAPLGDRIRKSGRRRS